MQDKKKWEDKTRTKKNGETRCKTKNGETRCETEKNGETRQETIQKMGRRDTIQKEKVAQRHQMVPLPCSSFSLVFMGGGRAAASGLAGWASGLAGWPRGGDIRMNGKSPHSIGLCPLSGPLPKNKFVQTQMRLTEKTKLKSICCRFYCRLLACYLQVVEDFSHV